MLVSDSMWGRTLTGETRLRDVGLGCDMEKWFNGTKN